MSTIATIILLLVNGTLLAGETFDPTLSQGMYLTVVEGNASPRIQYAADQLNKALAGISQPESPTRIILSSDKLEKVEGKRSPEGYHLSREVDGAYRVRGFGDSGVLYGALELAKRVTESCELPHILDVTEVPAFRLRGPCIGMQLTSILPGRDAYEYPYTPEHFPFFYDKDQWIEYLDFLVAKRMNTLYLWNGHPFASLVKLKEYPYALEVSEEVYQRNVEMFRMLTEEADKRGIWVIQMFYNIFVSKPFAEHHGIKTQHKLPSPLISDYTRKSIAKFIEMYPNVGLLICLGEALQGQDNQEAWMKQPHTGETPVTVIEETTHRAQIAVNAIEKAAPLVTRNQEEFERLRNDMHYIQLMTETDAEKVRAAILVLDYNFSHNKESMQQAQIHLAKSLDTYRDLADEVDQRSRD
jgi:hypothetical protein